MMMPLGASMTRNMSRSVWLGGLRKKKKKIQRLSKTVNREIPEDEGKSQKLGSRRLCTGRATLGGCNAAVE